MQSKKQNLEKSRRVSLVVYMTIVMVMSLYAGLHLGVVYLQMENPNLFGVLAELGVHIAEYSFELFSADELMVGIFLFVGIMINLYLYNEYLKISHTVNDAHGDAAFEDNMKQYNKEFLYNPKVVAEVEHRKVTNRYAPYNEEHKRVLKRMPGKKAIAECKCRALILAMGLYLALDGKWTQRNWNVVGFGASGAGKTRFFIIPNILQFDGSYIVVDPSGELEQKLGGGLETNGYIIKRFSTDDMTKSNRFNPLFYIRKTSDILIVVNTLIENTQEGSGKTSGDGDFWRKASQALLCAIIGYLVEVLPIEQRNFSNVLEILRMNNLDEHADAAEETDFDRLFQALGDANPASYAYHQYLTFKKAPAKIVLFLNIPLTDRTYSWITAMLFSIIFILLYHKGKVRMETEGLTDPELKVPVKCLIDECRNIGKIPNLGEYLATCRKYLISIVPIFQNYSQIVEVYGKEGANSIIGNCDTTIFLGGSDSDTLKIIVERLGKESVKTLSFGSSRGKSGSVSLNKQEVGRELMSRIQVEQMSNTECLVFIRALRPFKVKKYRLEEHPNYKYTAEADKRYLRANPYLLEYNDEEIEAVRVKPVGEEGYVAPVVVNSARKRALEIEKRKRAQAEAEKALEESGLKAADETKSKEQRARELEEKAKVLTVESSEVLREFDLEEMRIVDGFEPGYEFG
ncbi:MAG: type IV secretory system conjugative DNA transfer family protein [Lachnospiraceae bacterium]|nr:type IV secretory system conjugative DNA transfer family protein [Lachnospiraceae bacterium]